jgi:hypothetical protein
MTGLTRMVGLAVLAACAAGAGPVAAADAMEDRELRREHDAAVKGAIQNFQKDFKLAKTPHARALAVKQLAAEEVDPKVVAELGRHLRGDKLVRIAVAEALGGYRGDKLAAMTLVKAIPTSAKDPEVLAALLKALGAVGYEATIPLVAKHLQVDHDQVAPAAAFALGAMNKARAVDSLITFWGELDRRRKGGGEAKKKAGEQLRLVGQAMKDSLIRLTGKKYHYSQEYQAWWQQNRKGWKPAAEPPPHLCRHYAPPPAPGAAAPGAPVAPPVPAGPGGPVRPPAPGTPVKPGAAPAVQLGAIEGVFHVAYNLNGPAVELDGGAWTAHADALDFIVTGGDAFDFKNAVMAPSTDKARASMLRTGFTNSTSVTLTFQGLDPGEYLVCIWYWEDGAAEMFDVKVQGAIMASNFSTGGAGRWGRVGPWPARVTDGSLVALVSGGAVNVCGVEVWKKGKPEEGADEAPEGEAGGEKPDEAPKEAGT